MIPRPRWATSLLALATLLAAATPAAAQDPADQPPFGGEPVPRLVVPASPTMPPAGLRLSAAEAIAIGDATEEVQAERAMRDLVPRAGTRGPQRWEITYRDADGDRRALVYVDDGSGEVLEVWTGTQVETKLARGYEDAVSGDVNEWWLWIPLCLLFVAPFVDPRRPFRLLHLDLLALLGFSASLFFFNKGEIEVSAPLVYPFLGYLFARALLAGFRSVEHRDRLLPLARPSWLVAGIAGLVVLHAAFSISQDKVIDVGLAGVIGADRLVDGEDIYSEQFAEGLASSGDVRGDVYGPANYLAYVPFEQAFPYDGVWDHLPAARAAALGFDLLTALALFALGHRLRRRPGGEAGEEGRTLGIALAFAWLAYPFTLYTLGSSFNDALVPLVVVSSLLVLSSPPARGAMAALAGLTKFGPLGLAPLLAAGTGERRPGTLVAFAGAFAVTAAIIIIPLLPDGGLSEVYDRSFGYQASRGSPFSIWGQDPSLEPLQTAAKVFAVLLGLALFFWPRRRTPAQVAALAAAVLIAVQVPATHWFYPFAVWFAPLLLAALFAERRTPSAREATPSRSEGRSP